MENAAAVIALSSFAINTGRHKRSLPVCLSLRRCLLCLDLRLTFVSPGPSATVGNRSSLSRAATMKRVTKS